MKTNAKKNETNLERKSSMEKLIDDFHRNLPPPPPPAKNNESSMPFSDGDSMFSGSHLENSLNSLNDKLNGFLLVDWGIQSFVLVNKLT